MKHVTHADLERTQVGTTTDAAAEPPEPDKSEANPHRRTAEERAADAWTGQYPEAGKSQPQGDRC
ncbi:MAG TPA: hypothetical protein VGF55_32940 [Gemmataceae bacterium]|jgi:hypothetical protein